MGKLEIRAAAVAASLLAGLLFGGNASAQDATWLATPTATNPGGNYDFDTGANWNPATVPTGTATFGASSGTNISFGSSATTLGGFTFNAGASNYAFFSNNASLLTFNGAGIVINGGSATITNNSGGNTEFINSSTAGSANITNNSVGNTTFADSSTAGSATITNNGGGTSFVNSSTASTATITNNTNGLTNFGLPAGTDTSTAGSAIITNNSGGATQFLASTTGGSATITNNGGFTNFLNTSTAGNATIYSNAGLVSFFATSTAGNATIYNNAGLVSFFATSTAGGVTIYNNGGSTNFYNAGGAGNATIYTNSGSSTQFFDTSTAGSARLATTSGGLIAFQDTSTAGNATVANNTGTVTFNGASSAAHANIQNINGTVAFFDNSNGGSAQLSNGAQGVIDFSGSAGPLGNYQLSVGSLRGSGTFIVQSGQVVDTGSLALTSGALYLVHVSGANAGQIAVSGTATLAGNVGVDVVSRVAQTTTYTILSSTGLGGTSFGGATLELANSFASNPTLSYSGGNVWLTLGPGLLTLGLSPSANTNQRNLAGAIDNVVLTGGNLPAALNALFALSGTNLQNALTQVSGETATGAQQTTFDAMSQFMGLLTDPFMSRGGGFNVTPGASGFAEEDSQTSAYAASSKPSDAFAMFTKAPRQSFEPRWSVWASGFGGSQSTSGNATVGSNNTTSNVAGTAVGADYLVSPNTIAGFALAGGGTSFSVANGGSGRSDLFQAGAYLRHTNGPAYISAALAYGWQEITTNRTVTVAGFDQLDAQFNANAWSGRLEGGYRFVAPTFGGIAITPYAAAQFVTFDLPAYAEQALAGTSNFALAYAAKDATDVRTELGIRNDKSFALADGILTLRSRFAWAHDYDPDRSIAATFQSLPGASFVVNGAAQVADSALTTASVEMKWKSGWSVAATFEGEFSAVTDSYAGKGVVRYQW